MKVFTDNATGKWWVQVGDATTDKDGRRYITIVLADIQPRPSPSPPRANDTAVGYIGQINWWTVGAWLGGLALLLFILFILSEVGGGCVLLGGIVAIGGIAKSIKEGADKMG